MLHDGWLPLALVAVAALATGLAGLRLLRLNRHIAEPRLVRLTAFFLLFALAQSVLIAESLLLVATPARAHDALTAPLVLFWARHVVLVIALAAAVLAVAPPRTHTRAPFTVALVQLAHPVFLLIEGLLLLYLVVRTAMNHARRAEPGSLRVALGFLILLAGHLVPFIRGADPPPPLGPGDLLATTFLLLGALILASSVYARAPARRPPTERGERTG